MLIDQVAEAIRHVGAAEVLPRFRALAAGDIAEKSPGDFVTIADHECERVLGEKLRAIWDIPVVGEEAATADSSLLDLVARAPAVWVMDPIDGTANFVAGKTDFVVMVALVEAGATRAGWIWHPTSDSMLSAEIGKGTRRNGELLAARARTGTFSGILKRGKMPKLARAALAELPAEVGRLVRAPKSAGIEYAQLIDGKIDFLFYWRTLPWDHAPGALIAREAGLRVARPDGTPYEPGDGRHGLLAAAPAAWDGVAAEIVRAIGG